MTRTKILIPVVAAVATVAAFWFLVLAPKRDEVAKLDQQISKKQTQLKAAQAQIASYQTAKASYKANYATVTRLGKAVPADDDVRSLLVQLDSAADGAGVDFRAINVGGQGGSSEPTPEGKQAPPPGAVAVGNAGFSAMPFSFTFKGGFFNLQGFFNRLDRFVTVSSGQIDVRGRLLVLSSISLTPVQGTLSRLSAEVGATSYLVPPAEGVTNGATADGPGAPQGASPPVGAQPAAPPTTTATITGVR